MRTSSNAHGRISRRADEQVIETNSPIVKSPKHAAIGSPKLLDNETDLMTENGSEGLENMPQEFTGGAVENVENATETMTEEVVQKPQTPEEEPLPKTENKNEFENWRVDAPVFVPDSVASKSCKIKV